jgi:hypothetical protein
MFVRSPEGRGHGGKIFINYRRDDAAATAGRLHDYLSKLLGGNVFMDVDNVPAGEDFVDCLNAQVARSNIFLSIIGPNWLEAKSATGTRRLDDPLDYVRVEIAAALSGNIRVIPVVVDGAKLPKAADLPENLRPLVRRNAVELRNSRFGRDVDALVEDLRNSGQRWSKQRIIVAALGAAMVLACVVGLGWWLLARSPQGATNDGVTMGDKHAGNPTPPIQASDTVPKNPSSIGTAGPPVARDSPASAGPPATSPRPATAKVEPGHDILNAKDILLNTPISATINTTSDVDFFAFIMSGNKRDIVDVVINNNSTTLAPTITVYKPDKGVLGQTSNSTSGGDVSYSFVAQPNGHYYVSVSPYYNYGSYQLTVRAQNAFDEYEPNDDILSASLIKIEQTIEANIMDSGDVDYYQFKTDNNAKLTVFLENRSTTLAPTITVYKPDKGVLGQTSNSTSGGDVSYSFVAQPNSHYYVSVSPYYNYGKYALTIRPE